MKLSTDLITLRALEPEDLDLLYTIENDCELWDCSNTNVPYSLYALKQYIANCTYDIYQDRQMRLVAELNSTHESIGMVDITSYDPANQKAEIGIVVKKEHQGKGYARHMLEIIENYASEMLQINQLYAQVPDFNKTSIHLFENMNYKNIAKLPEWVKKAGFFHDVIFFLKKIEKK